MPLKLYSDIYPPEIKPVRDGWYLGMRSPNLTWSLYEWWQGRWWFAEVGREAESPVLHWRGLAFDVDAAKYHFEDTVNVSSQRIVIIHGVFIPDAEVE
jgi:hypothetical protein